MADEPRPASARQQPASVRWPMPPTPEPTREPDRPIIFNRRQIAPMVAVLLGLGLFVGVAFAGQQILVHSGNRAIAESGDFTLWCAMVGAMVTVYATVFVSTIDLARRWRNAVPWAAVVVAIYLGAALAVFAIWYLAVSRQGPTPLLAGTRLISRATFLIAVVGLSPTALGLGWEYAWLRGTFADLHHQASPAPTGSVLSGLLNGRKTLQRCLGAMSAAVSITVLGTGALRNAWLANGVPKQRFPSSSVLLFGALFTGAFALAYVPAFLRWRQCADRFVNAVYPLPEDARPSEEWAAGRLRLQQLIGTDSTIGKNFTAAFGILAPLATSIVGIFIPELVNRSM
jgi:hypothetical protein